MLQGPKLLNEFLCCKRTTLRTIKIPLKLLAGFL